MQLRRGLSAKWLEFRVRNLYLGVDRCRQSQNGRHEHSLTPTSAKELFIVAADYPPPCIDSVEGLGYVIIWSMSTWQDEVLLLYMAGKHGMLRFYCLLFYRMLTSCMGPYRQWILSTNLDLLSTNLANILPRRSPSLQAAISDAQGGARKQRNSVTWQIHDAWEDALTLSIVWLHRTLNEVLVVSISQNALARRSQARGNEWSRLLSRQMT